MGTAQPGTPVSAHSVYLVNENDTRAVALGLVEEVPDAAGTHAHEHLHELGAADGEEGHPCLAGHGLRQQGLARAGRPHQEHAFGDARTEGGELLGLFEEFDHFFEFFLGLIHSGHVVKGHGRLVVGEKPGPTPAEGKGLVVGPLSLSHQEVKQRPDEKQRQEAPRNG